MKRQDAPGRLELVRSFINTRDLEAGTDLNATGLREWLVGQHLLAPNQQVGEAELRAAVELREALRALAVANTGGPMDRRALELVNELGGRIPVHLRFAAPGDTGVATVRLHVPAADLDGALQRILCVIALAMVEGTWARLKICPAEDCRWAFYDHAKNRMGVWCQMAECGNRRKVRAHRARIAALNRE